jgi:2-polyprenyl-6-methoxyphenol hydroxylase-like FAD-dependent oxidoreductase
MGNVAVSAATETIDVLVVGAGPSGTALAIDLARRGLKIRIIDRQPAAFAGSRAKGLQPRSLEMLEDFGVLARVITAGGDYPLLGIHLGPFTLPWRMIKRGKPTEDRPHPNTWMVPQFRTDAILHARLTELGPRIEFGTELASVQQDGETVTATVRAGGSEQTIVARYLVGADGGASRVRSAMGIGFTGETDDSDRWIIIDSETTSLSRNRWHVWPGKGGKVTTACPLPDTNLFQWMIRIDVDDPAKLDPEDLLARVRTRTGNANIRLGTIHWSTVFRPNIRLAQAYRKGRVFLAGDAAHVHTPAGGQGLNTGIQDSYNLGWKLGQALAGAGDALLDTYQAERQPIADEMLARSTKRYKAIGKPSTDAIRRTADERQLELSYRDGPLAPASSDRTTTLRVGDRAPDAKLVTTEGAKTRLFELYRGPHFTAIAYGRKAADALGLAVWPSRGASLKRVAVNAGHRLDVSLTDTQQSFRRIYGVQGDTLLLIRPDGYIGQIATRDWGKQFEQAARTMTGALFEQAINT